MDCLTATSTRAHALPLDIARCVPSRECPQRCSCARANDWPDSDRLVMVDGSVAAHTEGNWCPMFIDARGVNLLTTDDIRVAA